MYVFDLYNEAMIFPSFLPSEKEDSGYEKLWRSYYITARYSDILLQLLDGLLGPDLCFYLFMNMSCCEQPESSQCLNLKPQV